MERFLALREACPGHHFGHHRAEHHLDWTGNLLRSPSASLPGFLKTFALRRLKSAQLASREQFPQPVRRENLREQRKIHPPIHTSTGSPRDLGPARRLLLD